MDSSEVGPQGRQVDEQLTEQTCHSVQMPSRPDELDTRVVWMDFHAKVRAQILELLTHLVRALGAIGVGQEAMQECDQARLAGRIRRTPSAKHHCNLGVPQISGLVGEDGEPVG